MTDILIVGAGPTGLTGALMLTEHGIMPRVIERRSDPSALSRAVGLLPSSMATFDRIGVGGRVREEAIAIDRALIFRDSKKLATLDMSDDPDPEIRLHSLPQDRTEAILAEALAERGITIEYGQPLEALDTAAERLVATTPAGTIACDELLGADGAHSVVRQAIGVEAKGYDLPEEWSIADIDVPQVLEPSIAFHLFGPSDAVFMIPLTATRARLVSNTPDALATIGDDVAVANVRRAGTFRISVRQVDRYRVGRVSLAGDAAHTHSPVGGRGMNLGIADAAEWADRLAAGTLDDYSAARHKAGAHTIGLSEGTRKMLLGGSGLKRAIGVGGFAFGSRVPPLARLMVRRIILA